MDMFIMLIMEMLSQMYTYVKTDQIQHSEMFNSLCINDTAIKW